jgi:hypothetical protein
MRRFSTAVAAAGLPSRWARSTGGYAHALAFLSTDRGAGGRGGGHNDRTNWTWGGPPFAQVELSSTRRLLNNLCYVALRRCPVGAIAEACELEKEIWTSPTPRKWARLRALWRHINDDDVYVMDAVDAALLEPWEQGGNVPTKDADRRRWS